MFIKMRSSPELNSFVDGSSVKNGFQNEESSLSSISEEETMRNRLKLHEEKVKQQSQEIKDLRITISRDIADLKSKLDPKKATKKNGFYQKIDSKLPIEEYRPQYWAKIEAVNEQISVIQGNQKEKTRLDKIKSAAKNRYTTRLKLEPKRVQKAYRKLDKDEQYTYVYK